MATLNDYFRTEARDFLRSVEREIANGPNAATLLQAVRGLRGTAQMAREQRVHRVAHAFETFARSLASGTATWSPDVADRARATLDDVRKLLESHADDEELDGVAAEAAARWQDVDTSTAITAAPRTHSDAGAGTREFREFAAREAAGISDVLDHGIQQLQDDPMNREPLKEILRRQRALLGAARLEEIPPIAEILRAVEDLTRVIARLDIGVKREWLDIYRVARDALQSTIAPLLRDELPEPSHAVSRLRHMHEELLERYGGDAAAETHGEGFMDPAASSGPQPLAPFVSRTRPAAPEPEVQGATAPPPVVSAAPVTARAQPAAEPPAETLELDESSIVAVEEETEPAADVIEIDTLSYTREDALRRALELYESIARSVAHDPQARDAVEELFDLIRIALE